MDPTDKKRLLTSMCNIKKDLHALQDYANSLNSQKLGKPMTTQLNNIELSSTISCDEERAAAGSAGGGGGSKRKASSKKRKSKKRKSKKRKSKTRRRR
jgi:hypothetical protein